jgi:hypothetical protein
MERQAERIVEANPVTPWFIATEPFSPADGDSWSRYVAGCGLTHLEEVVSLDSMLCPTVLDETRADYWPHIVNEDFMLDFFTDYAFLLKQVEGIERKNLLCVFRNPERQPSAPFPSFEFLGYDLVDRQGTASVLTNCGGFPEIFANSELSSLGLLPTLERARQVQSRLRALDLKNHHTDCHVWAIFRASNR